jgi:hypothetical protein
MQGALIYPTDVVGSSPQSFCRYLTAIRLITVDILANQEAP